MSRSDRASNKGDRFDGTPTVYSLTLTEGKTMYQYVVHIVTLLLSLKYDFVVLTANAAQAQVAASIVEFLRGHLYSNDSTHLRFSLLC